jgi:hypothetical protein
MAVGSNMAAQPSPWPQLDELRRELEEIAVSSGGDDEPTLTQATLAVSKAATALARAAGRKGREGQAVLDAALERVEEARQAVAQARLALAAAHLRREERARSRAAAQAGTAVSNVVEGDVEAACPDCGTPFVVRYRAPGAHPTVAFPVACPADGCDGTAEVHYPAAAFRVDVQRGTP